VPVLIEAVSVSGLITVVRLKKRWSVEKLADHLGFGIGKLMRIEANKEVPPEYLRDQLLGLLGIVREALTIL